MGEFRNKNHVSVSFVKSIFHELKSLDASPFLFDTSVLYNSLRKLKVGYKLLAIMNGFLKVGCPIFIGNEGEDIMVNGEIFEVVDALADSSHIFVLSHVTGHNLVGYGGAIKNLGMGGVSKKTKSKIHKGGKPIFIRDKCSLCGLCERSCPFNAIKIVEKTRLEIDRKKCPGCGMCINVCPNNAIEPKNIEMQKALALSAKAVAKNKKIIYVNVLKNITKFCDCVNGTINPFCSDIGYLISDDPVSIDKASIELVDKTMNSKNIFKKITGVNPNIQIKYGDEIKLGNIEYRLVKI